jgi:hypothetical protein
MESLTFIKKDAVVTYFKVLLRRSPGKANENHANFRHLAESFISCLLFKSPDIKIHRTMYPCLSLLIWSLARQEVLCVFIRCLLRARLNQGRRDLWDILYEREWVQIHKYF